MIREVITRTYVCNKCGKESKEPMSKLYVGFDEITNNSLRACLEFRSETAFHLCEDCLSLFLDGWKHNPGWYI